MGVSVGFVCYVSARHEGDQVLTACVGWWNVFRGMLVCGRLLFFADLPVCVTQIRLVSESVVELVYSGGLITQYNFYWKTLLRTLRSGCYMHRLLHSGLRYGCVRQIPLCSMEISIWKVSGGINKGILKMDGAVLFRGYIPMSGAEYMRLPLGVCAAILCC